MRQQPGQRDLPRRDVVPGRNLSDWSNRLRQRRPVLEPARSQRPPWNERDALTRTIREDILVLAKRKRETVLHRCDRHDPARFFQLAQRNVGEPYVLDLSLAGKLRQCRNRFRERKVRIGAVKLVEIDSLDLQPAQTGLA